jgi:O-glycosyl hydrolase
LGNIDNFEVGINRLNMYALKKFLPAVLLFTVYASLSAASRTASVSVDINTTYQHVSGFGGFSPSPQWSYWLGDADIDKMYGKGENQLGYNIMRLYIGNSEWSWNSAVANAKRAKKHGAFVFASPWSPPAEWKDNKSDSNGGHLLEEHYGDWANFLNRFIAKMKDNGVTIDAVSIQNEPDWATSYQSCVWTSAQFINFLKNYGSTINALIMCPDDVHFTHSYIDPILNDPDACREVDIVAGHFYGWNGSSYPLAEQKGKEVWMTEYLINERQEQQNQNINWKDDGFLFAKSINDAMLANMSAWVHYSLKRYYGCMGDGRFGTVDGEITKRGYIMSHFAKYVAGTTRIEHKINSSDGYYGSAYRSVTGDSIIFMIINPTRNDYDMTFRIPYESKSGLSVITAEEYNMKKKRLYYPDRTTSPVENVPPFSVCTFLFERTVAADVTLSTEGEGIVQGSGSFPYGSTATVSAEPSEGYRFIGWKVDTMVVSVNPSYTFTVEKDISLTAIFSNDEVFGVAIAPHSKTTVSGSGIFNPGTTVTVNAVPQTGYRFVAWVTDNGDSIFSNPYVFQVEKSISFSPVVEINRYNITVVDVEHGNIEGAGIYSHGDSALLTAHADWGYCLSHWIVNDSLITVTAGDSLLAVEVTEPLRIAALFTERHFDIELKADYGGSARIKGEAFGVRTNYLDTITVVAEVTRERYIFTGWFEENETTPISLEPEYTFVITGSRKLRAGFERQLIDITVICGENGSASVNNNKVIYNRTVILRIEPDLGFKLDRLLMNGEDVTADVNDNSFRMQVTEPITFNVTFTIDTGVGSLSVPVERKLYNLNGKEALVPEKGIFIEETVYPDGTRKVRKIIIQ